MDEIQKAIAAIRAQGGTDADVEAYLREKGFEPEAKSKRPLTPAQIARLDLNQFEKNAAELGASLTYGEQVTAGIDNMLNAMTFGASGIAADKMAGGDYTANRDARQAIYRGMPQAARVATSIAGGIANPLQRFVRPAQAGASLLNIAGRGMLEGIIQGGLTGYGENVGTTEGATGATVSGALWGGLGGGILAPAAAHVAATGRDALDPLLQYLPKFADSEGAINRMAAREASDAAASRVADARTRAASVGSSAAATPQVGAGMPTPMAVDVATPTEVAFLRGAAKSTAGREAMAGPFAQREADALPSITGDAPNAVKTENALRTRRAAQAKADFASAIEATKGIPISSKTIKDIFNTPVGQAAWKEIQAARKVTVVATQDPSRALPKDAKGNPVPDAEAVHQLTRRLRAWGKAEKGQVFPEGVDAEAAGDALALLDRAMPEMPLPYQVAVENYAAASRPIDAVQRGRAPWRSNPNPLNKRARQLTLENIEAKVPSMSAGEQALLREGKQFDVASRLNRGTSIQQAAGLLDNPASELSREMAVAGGPMPARIRAWNTALERQGDILSGRGEVIEPQSGGLLARAAEYFAPTAKWMAAKAGKAQLGEHATVTELKRALADAEFAKLYTGDVNAPTRALEAWRKMGAAKGRIGSRLSAQIGRQGGLLGSY